MLNLEKIFSEAKKRTKWKILHISKKMCFSRKRGVEAVNKILFENLQ
jgi:hypothetical protein